FGSLAGLRISKGRYDAARARKFKRGWAKWIPHLTVWDTTLRLIAAEAKIKRAFKPGWVLDDTLAGLATAQRGKMPIIYLSPDSLMEVVKAHPERPMAVAGFLHGVACHELTHLDGRMGEGHNEAFVSAREELGHATALLLPAISVLVSNLLGIKAPPGQDAIRARDLAREVERLQKKAAKTADDRRQLSRLRAELSRCHRSLDEGMRVSEQAGRAAEGPAPPTDRVPLQNLRQAVRVAIRARDALSLYDSVRRLMTMAPPPGLTSQDVEGFFERNERQVIEATRSLLGAGP
ncbi:MAG: hypothetical protein KC933_40735, partial [Myxococcales bacterium]|nr:hypothetical protein [Myxococcales bacterium]